MELITRKEAKEKKLTYYFTKKACGRGHVAKRLTRNCACVECNRIHDKARPRTDKERLRESAYRKTRPDIGMLTAARLRAKAAGVPCTITTSDIVIPTHCPILGIELKRNEGASVPWAASPSLDRVVPKLGYIPGNIQVISHRANTIKNDATIEELKLIVEHLENLCYNNFENHLNCS